MANGIEVWFGYTYLDYLKYAPDTMPKLRYMEEDEKAVGKVVPAEVIRDDPDEYLWDIEKWQEAFNLAAEKTVNSLLLAAWIMTCEELGYKVGAFENSLRRREIKTQWGETEANPFELQTEVGGEMEFEFPDLPIGVGLSGRYHPVLLDIRDDGMMPNPMMVWDDDIKKMIDVAAKHIIAVLPWMVNAKPMVVSLHY